MRQKQRDRRQRDKQTHSYSRVVDSKNSRRETDKQRRKNTAVE